MSNRSNIDVYVSGHDIAEAQSVAEKLRNEGFSVISTWHDDPGSTNLTDGAAMAKARSSLKQLADADVYVQVVTDDPPTGRTQIELGYAIARSPDVFLLAGRRQTLLSYHPAVRLVNDIETLIAAIEPDGEPDGEQDG